MSSTSKVYPTSIFQFHAATVYRHQPILQRLSSILTRAGSIALQKNNWNTVTQNLTDQINTNNASIPVYQQTINQELQAADAYVDYGDNTSSQTSNTI